MAVYNSNYTGAQVDAAVGKVSDITKTAQQINELNQVNANPTLAGTEAALEGIEVGSTKYQVEQPINVVANPTLAGTEAALEGIEVGSTKYKVEQPINVVANPTLAGTEEDLTGIQIGTTKYAIPSGGGGSGKYLHVVHLIYGNYPNAQQIISIFPISTISTPITTKSDLIALLEDYRTLLGTGTNVSSYLIGDGIYKDYPSSKEYPLSNLYVTANATTISIMGQLIPTDHSTGQSMNWPIYADYFTIDSISDNVIAL